MKLSIIIPMYNVELYIEKCLLSCLNQGIPHTDYEIIVVNDGSPDGSLGIAERIAATVDNVFVVSQENGGLSAARNKGLSLAKGEYVWFVDSDDWIEANCLASIIELCDGVDFIAISFNKVWSNRQEYYHVSKADYGKELLKKSIQQPAQFYILRREFLRANNLQFMEGVFHEDMEFTPRMAYKANRIHTMQDCVYNYLKRENSIMTTPNPKRAFDLIKVMNSLYEFKRATVVSEDWYVYEDLISLGFNNALHVISQTSVQNQRCWLKILGNNRHLLNVLFKSSKAKYKVQGIIFQIIPLYLLIKVYRFMQLFNRR